MIFPTIEVSVVLKEMRLKMAQFFAEYEGVFIAEAGKALEAAMTPSNIERLLAVEAEEFIREVAKAVFSNYELKSTIARKIAGGLAEKFKDES